jgi:hypothetical protein
MQDCRRIEQANWGSATGVKRARRDTANEPASYNIEGTTGQTYLDTLDVTAGR